MERYEDITDEHAQEAAFLWHLRQLALSRPHYLLDDLESLDERLSAHIDGLRTSSGGLQACRRLLAEDEPWAAAPLALFAIEGGDGRELATLLALAEQQPALTGMLEAALGWASPRHLRGLIRELLQSSNPLHQRLALAACAAHRVDPGPALPAALASSDEGLRALALRAAGQLGRQDLLHTCLAALDDDAAECRYRAAAAGLLLGDRGRAVDVLVDLAQQPGGLQTRALRRVLKVLALEDARQLLASVSRTPEAARELIAGTGHAGDVRYIGWLLERMHDPAAARLAGEAFSLITGVDLGLQSLDRPPPATVDAGPTDDPEDAEVAMDPDEDLPWPEPQAVAHWWSQHAAGFRPDARYFLGAPVEAGHCTQALRRSYQRQRIAAAQHISLMSPGQPLFAVDAPAWRQRRLLG